MITNEDKSDTIYNNIKDRVNSNDYICSDLRKKNPNSEDGENNPTIRVFDSYRANNDVIEAICHKLIIYENDHPSNWNRSYTSICREWRRHNDAYIVPATRERTKDVDLDARSENTVFFYNYQYKQ